MVRCSRRSSGSGGGVGSDLAHLLISPRLCRRRGRFDHRTVTVDREGANNPDAERLQSDRERMCVGGHVHAELTIPYRARLEVGWLHVLEHVEDGKHAAEEVAERKRNQVGVKAGELVLERGYRASVDVHARVAESCQTLHGRRPLHEDEQAEQVAF